jgi:anti-anti-sigma regulatory factor
VQALVAAPLPIFDIVYDDLAQVRLSLALIAPVLLLSFALYAFRRSRYAEILVYADLTLINVLLAIADPISGGLGGETWVLFQLLPPLAILIVRRPRAAVIMVVVSALCLATSALAQLTGVIAVHFSASTAALHRGLVHQLLVLIVLSLAASWIGAGERRALVAAIRANEQKGQLNRELSQRLDDLRARDEQIRQQQAQEQQLRQTILELSSPVLPILDGVVLLPLVGAIDSARTQEMQCALLTGIERHRARIVVFDVTGVPLVDTAVAQAILQAAGAAQLLGAQPILVGIRPEVAQTIVGLGIDLQRIVVQANLQAGVTYAMRLAQFDGRPIAR